MISLTLSDVSKAVNGSLSGQDASFSGVSSDTRSLSEGQLFVALIGANFDGHEMLGDAKRRGAVGAIVSRKSLVGDLSQIQVSDTKLALGNLARFWRRKFSCPIVGVTGSAGKTTVKNMLAEILRSLGSVLATPANMNNEIGLPMTLFKLSSETQAVVLEMGAARKGDISYLAKIAEPNYGVITLCSPAHLTGFGSIDVIAETKGELVSCLPKDGVAILNADDDYFGYWSGLAGTRKIWTFGSGGDFYSEREDLMGDRSSFSLGACGRTCEVTTNYLGMHNINNALAASAAAYAVGVSISDVAKGLASCMPTKGRLYPIKGKNGLSILDDTYNANPSALLAALNVLRNKNGAKWVIMGDMKELGGLSSEYHCEAGKEMKNAGVDRLFTIGEMGTYLANGFEGLAEHFSNKEKLISRILEISVESEVDINLLVKGSRAMQLEVVVNALIISEENR